MNVETGAAWSARVRMPGRNQAALLLLAAVLVLPSDAYSQAFVQKKYAAANATSVAATFDAPPTEGNLLAACIFSRATTLTNPMGWTTAVEEFNATESDWVRIAYKVAGASESSTVTFTQDADVGMLSITEWSGLATAVHDQTASTGRTTGVESLSSGTTGTTTVAEEVAIACFGMRADVTASAVNNSFTSREAQSIGAGNSLIAADKVLSATGTQTTTASWTTSATAIGAIATFKTGATPGAFVQKKYNAANSTSVAATFDAPPTEGNLLAACIFSRATTLTNPVGWTTAVEVFNATEADWVRIAYKVAGSGESSTATFTQSPTDVGLLSITEWSGMTSAVHDQTAVTVRTPGVQSLSSGTTVTTTSGNEIAIACFGMRADVTGSAVNNSFSAREAQSTGGGSSIIAADKVLVAIGTPETTASWTNAATAMGAISTFKAAGAGGGGASGPPVGSLQLLGVGR